MSSREIIWCITYGIQLLFLTPISCYYNDSLYNTNFQSGLNLHPLTDPISTNHDYYMHKYYLYSHLKAIYNKKLCIEIESFQSCSSLGIQCITSSCRI